MKRGDKPDGFAEIVSVDGSVELLDETDSQLVPLSVVTDVVKGGLPEPEASDTCTVAVAAEPVAGAVNVTEVGFNPTVNALATVTVTGIERGKPAPVPVSGVTTILPL